VTITDGRQIVGRSEAPRPPPPPLFPRAISAGVTRVRVRTARSLTSCMLGRFMAFDRHMNLVLGDSEEFRKLPPKKGRSEDEVRSPTYSIALAHLHERRYMKTFRLHARAWPKIHE